MNENEKYNEWLNAVKTNQPVLNDPEGLKQQIMLNIQSVPRKSGVGKRWRIITLISSAAAFLLLCLLIDEIDFRPSASEKTAVSTDKFDDSALKRVYSTFSNDCVKDEPAFECKNRLLKRWQEQRDNQARKKKVLFEKRYPNL